MEKLDEILKKLDDRSLGLSTEDKILISSMIFDAYQAGVDAMAEANINEKVNK